MSSPVHALTAVQGSVTWSALRLNVFSCKWHIGIVQVLGLPQHACVSECCSLPADYKICIAAGSRPSCSTACWLDLSTVIACLKSPTAVSNTDDDMQQCGQMNWHNQTTCLSKCQSMHGIIGRGTKKMLETWSVIAGSHWVHGPWHRAGPG